MNKFDMIGAVASKAKVSKTAAREAINAVFDNIQETLSKGESVRLIGFGTFKVNSRAERVARNPRTGAEVDVPAKKVPAFVAGQDLKNAVNQ